MPAAAERRRPPVGTAILLALAGLFYAAFLGALSGAPESDAAGKGMAEAFAALYGLVLWLLLALLLVVGGVQGKMPGWAAVAAFILLPLSAVAAVLGASLYEDGTDWALFVLMVLPPLVAACAVWARFPALQRMLPLPAGAALWGVALLLCLVPFPIYFQPKPKPDPAQVAQQQAEAREEAVQQERRWQDDRAADLARFAALGPDSPLADYLPFVNSDDPRFGKALAGARLVTSRQEDAVALLQAGKLTFLENLYRFDLRATPALCQAYGNALARAAAEIDRSVRSDYLTAAIDIEGQVPNLTWLAGAGCDLDDVLARLETNLRAVSDSPRIDRFADSVAAARRGVQGSNSTSLPNGERLVK